jgi:hypothetical protein
MKTTIATLAIITLSFSQANANDAVKQGILGVWQCVQVALDMAPGKPRVHPDAMLVAIRACKGANANLGQALDAAGVYGAERQSVVESTVDVMFDAWVAE